MKGIPKATEKPQIKKKITLFRGAGWAELSSSCLSLTRVLSGKSIESWGMFSLNKLILWDRRMRQVPHFAQTVASFIQPGRRQMGKADRCVQLFLGSNAALIST